MLDIIIPCAGGGKRFREAGYLIPKPFMDVAGKSMIARVMESLTPPCEHRFQLLDRALVGTTQGAVDTLLRADIDLDGPVLVANCDQLIHFPVKRFLNWAGNTTCIMTFTSSNPHHSYVRVDEMGEVLAIAEKEVISSDAVVGVYYFPRGSLLIDYGQKVIANNVRYNGEFYLSELLKLMIEGDEPVTAYPTRDGEVTMLGTPEELTAYLDSL